MMHSWRIATFINGIKDAVVYRSELFIEILASAVIPAMIQWAFWYAFFKQGHQQTVGGYTYEQMLSYTCVSLLFSQIRGGNFDFDLQEMIRSGQLSQYLLRPVGIVEFFYIRGIASRLFVAFFSLLVGTLVGSYFGIEVMKLYPAMLLAIMGNIIHYQVGAVLAASAFVFEEAYVILMVKNMLVGFLSGEVIPLYLFPDSFQWLIKSTPFYLYVFGPAQYVLGNWSDHQLWQGYLTAFCWILGLWGMITLTWGQGMKRYLSLGG